MRYDLIFTALTWVVLCQGVLRIHMNPHVESLVVHLALYPGVMLLGAVALIWVGVPTGRWQTCVQYTFVLNSSYQTEKYKAVGTRI